VPIYGPQPLRLPDGAWRLDGPLVAACRDHDANTLFRLVNTRYGIAQERIAVLVGLEAGEISKRIRGLKGQIHHVGRWIKIAEGLGMPEHARRVLFCLPTAPAVADPHGPGNLPAVHDKDPNRTEATPADGAPNDWQHPQPQEVTVNRRELLHLSGATLTGAYLDVLLHEPSRLRAALDTGTVSHATLTELEQAAADLGIRVARVDPDQLLPEALSGFHQVRQLVNTKQTLRAQRELTRLAAMFGTVIAEILFNQAQLPLARQWYATARRAAIEASDTYLADIALGGSAYLPTYTADPRGVLDHVDPRLGEHAAPSPAVAWLWAFKAKAHAALGDRKPFQSAIDNARQALDGSEPDRIHPGTFSFMPEKLHLYEAHGWIDLHDADPAIRASDAALALYDPQETTSPALARFERASALVHASEVDEACQITIDAVLDPHTYHGITILTRARQFDQLLGSQNSRSVRVREWRDVLATLQPPQPALVAAPAPALADT